MVFLCGYNVEKRPIGMHMEALEKVRDEIIEKIENYGSGKELSLGR